MFFLVSVHVRHVRQIFWHTCVITYGDFMVIVEPWGISAIFKNPADSNSISKKKNKKKTNKTRKSVKQCLATKKPYFVCNVYFGNKLMV